MFGYLSETLITLFVVIDPLGVTPMFIGLTTGKTLQRRRQIALKATCIGTVIFLCFAFVGDYLLDKLHISESSFRIAGGLLLLLTAIDMVVAKHSGISSTTPAEETEAAHSADITVFPLAIPLIAGPGGLASITILMRQVEGDLVMQAATIGVLFFVLSITYLCLALSGPITKVLGVTGTNVITRVFGIILAALAIQFIIDGLKISFSQVSGGA